MNTVRTVAELREALAPARRAGRSIGLVPTMGYLHEGHLSLVRIAREAADTVVMSIFVNPLQFGVGEDYEEYPRDLTRDSQLAESAGVAAIFAPAVAEMYYKDHATFVDVDQLTECWLPGLKTLPPGIKADAYMTRVIGRRSLTSSCFSSLERDISM